MENTSVRETDAKIWVWSRYAHRYDLAGFSIVHDALNSTTTKAIERAVEAATRFPSCAFGEIGGIPSGWVALRSFVLGERSLAVEKVEQGGAKWKMSLSEDCAHCFHITQSCRTSCSTEKSKPPVMRS